jgi:hypothetical protein
MADAGEGRAGAEATPFPVVVLAAREDPYYALAEEIAAAEGAQIISSLDELVADGPAFLLWVASPQGLSDEVLVDFATAWGERMKEPRAVIVPGLISGSTLEEARALWARADEATGRVAVVVNAANPSADIPERITVFDGAGASNPPYSKESVVRALVEADHLTYTGHGGSRALFLAEGVSLRANDLPSLPPVVVATGACNTFRPWNEGSIALAFTDRGAATYVGFAYSPNAGYLVGAYEGLPFRYTWPDLPLGLVVLLQNRGTLQGFAALPYHFLLGDPRIALADAAPYRVVADEGEGRARALRFAELPVGAVPLRVPGGAGYDYVEVPGVASAATGDPFYNARLQTLDAGEDKYLLVVTEGGELEVILRRRPPLGWRAADGMLDALDHTLIFLGQTASGGTAITLGAAGAFALGAAVVFARRPALRGRVTGRRASLALLAGLVAAVLHAAYVLGRVDVATVTSKPLVFEPLMVSPTLALVTLGAFLFLVANSAWGKGMALVVATFNAWMPGLFALAVTMGFNLLAFRPRTGAYLYNAAPAAKAFLTAAVLGLLWWALFALLAKRNR